MTDHSREVVVGRSEQDDDGDPFEDCPYCLTCGGGGVVIRCPDSMCRVVGECIHGDEEVCRDCDGTGESWWVRLSPSEGGHDAGR